jgi:hypothetical protein
MNNAAPVHGKVQKSARFRNAYTQVTETERERPLGKSNPRWKDSIKTYCKINSEKLWPGITRLRTQYWVCKYGNEHSNKGEDLLSNYIN